MADSRYGIWCMRIIIIYVLSFTLIVIFLEPKKIFVTAANIVESFSFCKTNMSAFLPSSDSNLSTFSCSPTWNNFAFKFGQSDDNVVTIVLAGKNVGGWIGIGFSNDWVMYNSSAVVGWMDKNGKASIKRYYLQGYSPARVKPDAGELQFTTTVPPLLLVHETSIYLAFQLKFAVPLKNQSIILALGSSTPVQNRLAMHLDKTSMLVDFTRGSVTSSFASNDENGDLRIKHGVISIIAWGAILLFGVIIARFFKHHDPQWYYLHLSMQLVGFLLGMAGIVLGRKLYERLGANLPVHRGIGLFVTVLSILQVMAIVVRPAKNSKSRKYWNWYHHWVGRIALLFAALNIIVGIQSGGGEGVWKKGYGFLAAIVLATVIVLEIWLRLRNSEKSDEAPVLN